AMLPLIFRSYFIHVYTIGFYYVILAVSWNLLAGFTGQFALATHAFASIGGYSSALLVIYSGVPIWLGIPIGMLSAGLVGALLGGLTLKMRKIYLALATWAFAESYRLFISSEYKWTRGDLGLNTPLIFDTAEPLPYYFLLLVATALTLWAVYEILKSRIGFYLRAIRDDEEAAQSMGVNTVRWKLFAFTVSSMLAGSAGALYGHYIGLLSPVGIKFYEMALIIIMVCTGGMRSFWGPVIGALFIQVVSELLRYSADLVQDVSTLARDFAENRMVIFAVLVILLMRFYREGINGMLRAVTRLLTRGGISQS
ncbi:MAG: branched-chain amino acid ABC transporter permease, partial [SAR324 cluster bacterium]|nr:branched-chain amino acid ABC transporter permease [SAR324 cluster bacterium]